MSEPKEFITDEQWELFSNQVLSFLNKYSKKLDIVGFLGQIKQKLDDCSRTYTGSWVIEMLFKTNEKHAETLGASFYTDIKELQLTWDTKIMLPIRQQRQDYICEKCIEYFFDTYKQAEKIITKEKASQLPAQSTTHRWNQISKMCADKGLLEDPDYKEFLGKLMVEMVKY